MTEQPSYAVVITFRLHDGSEISQIVEHPYVSLKDNLDTMHASFGDQEYYRIVAPFYTDAVGRFPGSPEIPCIEIWLRVQDVQSIHYQHTAHGHKEIHG
jgi:hypothetical protein